MPDIKTRKILLLSFLAFDILGVVVFFLPFVWEYSPMSVIIGPHGGRNPQYVFILFVVPSLVPAVALAVRVAQLTGRELRRNLRWAIYTIGYAAVSMPLFFTVVDIIWSDIIWSDRYPADLPYAAVICAAVAIHVANARKRVPSELRSKTMLALSYAPNLIFCGIIFRFDLSIGAWLAFVVGAAYIVEATLLLRHAWRNTPKTST